MSRIGVALCGVLLAAPVAAQTCHEETVCHTETVCTVPKCSVVTDHRSVVTVNAEGLTYTGTATTDIVTVAITKTSGQYAGWTAYGSLVPVSDGKGGGIGSVTFRLGTGAGSYKVTLIGSGIGKVDCATFTFG